MLAWLSSTTGSCAGWVISLRFIIFFASTFLYLLTADRLVVELGADWLVRLLVSVLELVDGQSHALFSKSVTL